MEKIKAVFFVSVIRPLNKNVTSTYIMTSSLLKGIKANNKKIVFFAICEHEDEYDEVREYFNEYADVVIPLPSCFGYNLSKYKNMIKMLYRSFCIGYHEKKIIKSIEKINYKPELIISHSPSFEGICYSKALKKHYPQIKYYQYWSDPIALSGINPDDMNIKRLPFRIIESHAFNNADSIIYGTKTLMEFQKKLYPKSSSKMTYIDIPYVEKEILNSVPVTPRSILYAGNYHKSVRNIDPLIDAVESIEGFTLDIYGDGEYQKRELKNTHIHGRISADELSKIEGKYEYLVCILNHSCIQIPGKIFYDMAREVKIIVIADGKYQKDICDYLSKYNRFIPCKNIPKNISINIINNNGNPNINYIRNSFSPKKVSSYLITGGINENSYN